jgi:hypothetical protein
MGQAERETAAKTAVSALEMQADGTGQKIGNAPWIPKRSLLAAITTVLDFPWFCLS